MTPEEARETFIGYALMAYPIIKNEEMCGKQLEIFICFDFLLTEWIAGLNASLDLIGDELEWHRNVLVEYIDLISPWVRYSQFEGDQAAKIWRDQNVEVLDALRARMSPAELDQ